MTWSTTRWREDGLGDAADGDRAALRGDFDLDLQGDVVVEVDGGRHLDIDADVLVLELGIDERADDGGGRAGLIGAGGDGDARADLHGRLLIVGGADARALQNLGIGVGEQQIQGGRADGDGEVSGLEMGQIVERGRGCGAGCAGGAARELVEDVLDVGRRAGQHRRCWARRCRGSAPSSC